MEDVRGKVAVVTGAASGIGRGMAESFGAAGMKLVLADVDADRLASVAQELEKTGAEVLPVKTDVSRQVEVDELARRALDAFGAVHVVCNNAGVAHGGVPTWESTLHDWEWIVGVNLMGVVHGVRTFTPLLLEQGEGHIVNTASMAGLISAPFMATYNVSKHAVVTLSETLYADLQLTGNTGVGVSVLCPGWVQTRIHESARNRPGTVEGAGHELTEIEKLLMETVGGLIAEGLNPLQVAGLVLDAVQANRFYILTHPEWKPMIADRLDRIMAEELPSVASLPMNGDNEA